MQDGLGPAPSRSTKHSMVSGRYRGNAPLDGQFYSLASLLLLRPPCSSGWLGPVPLLPLRCWAAYRFNGRIIVAGLRVHLG